VAEVEGLEGGIGQSGALEFLGIDNIHVMRDSEKKLKEICNHLSLQDKGWLTALDNSRYALRFESGLTPSPQVHARTHACSVSV
jgi:hypothetical protein